MMTYRGNQLIFMIDEKKFFQHFITKMQNLVKLKLNFKEFDSFNEKIEF